jgi:hypothetical protein
MINLNNQRKRKLTRNQQKRRRVSKKNMNLNLKRKKTPMERRTIKNHMKIKIKVPLQHKLFI